eukprot:TRINITY_DN10691_c0_g1_i1.p1 TRINITY_DN10691_c0_g1~~TRINITY_DN10691_c0_g1_i1.p1  ORF type:complete len:581 (-),score=12.36 TRINITY_DN10691_c0_g1_i1:144-1886(-)
MDNFVGWGRLLVRRALTLKTAKDTDHDDEEMPRHYGLLDLWLLGVGGTIGTGIFALCGRVANEDAGPAIILCWAFGGFATILSGLAYMELSSRFPDEGSTYAYSYHLLGELFAVISALLLSLEYGLSGCAVARAWADKLVAWFESLGWTENVGWVSYEYCNLAAGLMQLVCILLLAGGLSIGKRAVNIVSAAKVLLVLFLIIGGFILFKADNLSNGFPPPQIVDGEGNKRYGWDGVFRGTTSVFFGYIGFDEVCCLAAEAKNPRRNMPLAVIGVITGVCVLSILASLSLVGMQRYTEIDIDAGFGHAFETNGWKWASQFTQIGELLTLPVVVLVSFLAQPRLQLAMAQDRLLPKWIAHLTKSDNPLISIVIAGAYCMILTILVPFDPLGDLISAGVLLSFNISNVCLIMVRTKAHRPTLAPSLTWTFMLLSCCTAFVWQKTELESKAEWAFFGIFSLSTTIVGSLLCVFCPPGEIPGIPEASFRVPFVPLLPLLAIQLNWVLIAQQSWQGIGQLFGYLAFAVVVWLSYGFWHSKLRLYYDALSESEALLSQKSKPKRHMVMADCPSQVSSDWHPDHPTSP